MTNFLNIIGHADLNHNNRPSYFPWASQSTKNRGYELGVTPRSEAVMKECKKEKRKLEKMYKEKILGLVRNIKG